MTYAHLASLLAPAGYPAWVAHEATAPAFERAFAEFRLRWPTLQLSAEEFAERLAVVLEHAAPTPASLDALRPVEQGLVAAALLRRPGAVEALEAVAFSRVQSVAHRFTHTLTPDELIQRVRTKLLAASSGTPLLSKFSGATSIDQWVRVVAVRLGLDVVRASTRRVARERAFPEALPHRDPEFYWMRQLYTDDFERILSRCLAELNVRERTLLKAQIVHGLSLDEQARVWAVHRSTIARWLCAARTGLLTAVRAGLKHQAGLSESELDSVLNLIQSGVSEGVIARGLQSVPPEGAPEPRS
ncbi:MAG: hypothetical protein AAGA54_23375 [Myxococcota bacterium]